MGLRAGYHSVRFSNLSGAPVNLTLASLERSQHIQDVYSAMMAQSEGMAQFVNANAGIPRPDISVLGNYVGVQSPYHELSFG